MLDPELALAALGFVILFGSMEVGHLQLVHPSASIQEHAEGPHPTFGKAGPFPSPRRRLQRWAGRIAARCRTARTLSDPLWRYAGNADRTDPAAAKLYSRRLQLSR
jgi:hypothetical protein